MNARKEFVRQCKFPWLLSPPTKRSFGYPTYETFFGFGFVFPRLRTCIARFSASTSTYKRSFGYPTYETFFGSLVTVPRYSYRNVQTFLSFSTPTKHEKCSSVLYPPTKTQKVFLGFADGKTYIALEELRVFYDSNYIKYCMWYTN
jgi:hypothetical protein